MWCHRLIPITTMACAAVLAFSACNRKPAAPELQTTTGVQPRAESVSLTGCLQRGVIADDTFVLLVSQTAGTGTTATYQLTARPELNLRDHVGEQVEVSGALRSELEFTSAAGAVKEQPYGWYRRLQLLQVLPRILVRFLMQLMIRFTDILLFTRFRKELSIFKIKSQKLKF